ncbi:hypothetical protein Q4E93_14740 [Flavitalea sp. BT771]|uniref:hypothetical protein n=1 Tax=Flavitalea sp. BT771 TaxID=3063329 RepID=UPI0026E16DB2|nr:hypothetical protein [Flavitalea sp. BT771]MDO6431860.1 hypothetical protein [Flavitalea sp. BT771]MDV6220769.1 hypothetical protein [Flavitalea sp. BT771]
MSKLKQIGCAAILLLSITAKGLSQTVSIYFAAPTATISASFPGLGQTTDMPGGYSAVQLTAANEATFLAMPLPRLKYVYGLLQAGTPVFIQRDKIFNNSDRTVDLQYFLVDDRTALTDGNTKLGTRIDDNDHKLYIWPAAKSLPSTPGRYLGYVGLGEHQLEVDQSRRAGGNLAIDEVVLHETSHTQWVGYESKWPATSSGFIAYGADGGHSVVELLGDQELSINEGLATFYGYTLNRPGMDNMYAVMANPNLRYFVEGRSVLAGDATLNAVPTRTRVDLRDSHGNPVLVNGVQVAIFQFPWRDIPGFYLLFCENTSTAFYSFYWDNAYLNKDTAFSFIGFSANAMHDGRMNRFLTYSCNRLALKMEEYNASPAGQADASRTSSMLPFAILDLVTHFSMSDADYKADYDRHHPDRQPRAYTEYFTNHRAALRTLVQADLAASPIRLLAAMDKIKNYCRQPATIF